MLLIFTHGVCYPLVTPEVLKHRNTLDNFIGRRCLEVLLKVAFCKNSENFSGKWSSCCTDLVKLSA